MSFLLDDVRMKNLKTYKEDLNNFILILREIFFNELNFKCMITETFSFRTETIKALESQNFRRYYPSSPRIKEKISSIFHLLMYEASSNRK